MTPGRKHRECAENTAAFTLIEVLLVVVIVMITTGIAVPAFVNSYRGVKMRTSVRGIVMASRYAHSVAVLNQMQTALFFDVEKGDYEIVALAGANALSQKERFLEGRGAPAAAEGEEPQYSIEQRLSRELPDGIRIIAVESGQDAQQHEGIFWINFYPNGMCDEFSVTLADDRDRTVTVGIDPLSSKPKVEYDR